LLNLPIGARAAGKAGSWSYNLLADAAEDGLLDADSLEKYVHAVYACV
jgi:hypothetical protein